MKVFYEHLLNRFYVVVGEPMRRSVIELNHEPLVESISIKKHSYGVLFIFIQFFGESLVCQFRLPSLDQSR